MNIGNATRILAIVGALIAISGCATSSGVIVNPAVKHVDYKTVYVVTHGDNSADMDANLQRELLRHGLSVSSGHDGGAPAGTQLIAKYADDWKWDMAMYLRSFDVMLFDGSTNTLLASGHWKNSTLHGFYGSEKVVAKVVDDTLAKVTVQ